MRKTVTMLPLAIRSLFKKPATIDYPNRKAGFPADFRGRIVFDASKCIGCKLCMKDCPSKAIEITKTETGFICVLHMDKCIYCGQCVDSCRKDALSATPEFEHAELERSKLTVSM